MGNIEHEPRVTIKTATAVIADLTRERDSARALLALASETAESRRQQLRGAVDLLRWALPYLPEPLPSMDGGNYAKNYDRAVSLSSNFPAGGQSAGSVPCSAETSVHVDGNDSTPRDHSRGQA